ncbi:MAG TPA: hypothetical protein VFP65_25720, partial [Anaeromyxobacteraceae bacterium]|nr:hypothetical protein [Anaeromyxobacteraceae bacterium]
MSIQREGLTPQPSLEAEPDPGPAEQVETAVVAAAVAQGLLVGAWLAFFPDMALRAGGFPAAAPFFVRFAGVLHLVLAFGYALDYRGARRVTLLVAAKAATVLFLVAAWIGEGIPALLAAAIAVEAGLAAGAALAHGPAGRSRRARARL